MAAPTLETYANAIMETFGPVIAKAFTQLGPGNQFIGKNSILAWLAEPGYAGGNRIRTNLDLVSQNKTRTWPVHSATVTAVSYDPHNDAFPAASAETINQATIGPKAIGVPVEWANIDRAMSAGQNMAGAMKAIAWDVKQKLKAIVAALEAQLLGDGTGNSAKDFDGIKSFMKATGSYAGIAQTNAYWQPSLNTVGGSISLAEFRETKRALENRGGFTDVLVSPLVWDQARELFEPSATNLNAFPSTIGTPMVDTFEIDGYPIRKIQGMADDEAHFLNRPDIELHLVPQDYSDEMGSEEFKTVENVPVGVRYDATGRDVKSIFLCTYGNLVCELPRNQGALLSLS